MTRRFRVPRSSPPEVAPPLVVHPDEEAVDRRLLWLSCGPGEAEALAMIYDRHAAAAYALAHRICGARDAEDVVEEAFLALWRERRTGQPDGQLRRRLLRIIHRCALERLDGNVRRPPSPADLALSPIAPRVLRLYELHALAALEAVPPVERECIELAYFGGLTVGELAVRCHLEPAAVKAHLSCGLHLMLGSLSDHVPSSRPSC
jgi:RNA polymerase sigma-70 factor (ECF subfamily)